MAYLYLTGSIDEAELGAQKQESEELMTTEGRGLVLEAKAQAMQGEASRMTEQRQEREG